MRLALLALMAVSLQAEYFGFAGMSVNVSTPPTGKPQLSRPVGQLILAVPITEGNYSYSLIEPSADGTTTATGYARRVWAGGRVALFGLAAAGASSTAQGGIGSAFAGGGAATLALSYDWHLMGGARYQTTPGGTGMVYTVAFGRRF